ncbi:MAG: hypothetical protein U0354_13300 [Candidatus Sericytochromatia bacterium]
MEKNEPIYEKIKDEINVKTYIYNSKIKEIMDKKLNNLGFNNILDSQLIIPDIIIFDDDNIIENTT